MPPRTTKKTPPGPGNKRAARAALAASVNLQAHPEESNVKAEEEADEDLQPIATQEKVIDLRENVKAEENGDSSPKKDIDAKELVDEYEKDERLDFEDNDPGYEHEEYGGLEYDEKENDHDRLEEGEKLEEEPDEADIGEEEDDAEEEESEDANEELEHEEDDEHVEEQTEMIDVAEEEEHHEVFKERRKRKEFEIFVGGLDKDATENDLRKVFSEVGEVTEVRLLMNPQTKKNKGFAFLRFATVEQAKRACSLKNPVVNGKQCGVTPSQDSDTLFLGNICRTWTKAALKDKLKHYGVDNIEDLTLVDDSNNVGLNRGFAFLEFSSRADAMDAFKLLQKRDVQFGVDRPAKVSFADSFIDPGDEIMAQVKTVFIDGISATWDEGYIKKLLKIYGEIEKVELARNMPSARRKDFGFVTFDTHDAAVTCAKNINNEDLGEGNNKAKVRARLSRPLQRGKGKHVPRGDFRPARRSIRGVRSPWDPAPRSLPLHHSRGSGPRLPPVVPRRFSRPASIRERKPALAVSSKSRPMAPLPRSYDRRPPVPQYPKGSLKREYAHRADIPPRNRAGLDYGSRIPSDRRPLYKNDYPPHGPGYSDVPRGGTSHSIRKAYIDDGYSQRYDKPPPAYREGRGREYDSMSGSKRPYAAMDEVPSRYGETGVRHSRARLEYDAAGSASHYGDAYSDRLGRSNLGYNGSRSSMSGHDSHGMYNDRQSSYGGRDISGMYSSNFGGGYMSRPSDVGGSSYPSLYSGRGFGGNSYMGSGGSGSYY